MMSSTEKDEYWFNTVTGEVEQGKQSLALNRLGPFESREEAANALHILKERSELIAQEDEQEWRNG